MLRQIDDVGARTITVVSSDPRGTIPASIVDRTAALSGVAWVVGLGPVSDVRNSQPVGGPVPMRAYRGLGAPLTFSSPPPGGGVFVSATSARRLGVAGAFSVVDPGLLPVVGWFRVEAPLTDLDAYVLAPATDTEPWERVVIEVREAGLVEAVAAGVPLLFGTAASDGVSLERSQALLSARSAVQDEVLQRGYLLVRLLLCAAMSLVSLVVFAGTLAARRDFGRRRALGATRAQLTALVVLATTWPASLGVVAGTGAGILYLTSRLGRAPDWQFPVAVGILTILSFVLASALPALGAAARAPRRVVGGDGGRHSGRAAGRTAVGQADRPGDGGRHGSPRHPASAQAIRVTRSPGAGHQSRRATALSRAMRRTPLPSKRRRMTPWH